MNMFKSRALHGLSHPSRAVPCLSDRCWSVETVPFHERPPCRSVCSRHLFMFERLALLFVISFWVTKVALCFRFVGMFFFNFFFREGGIKEKWERERWPVKLPLPCFGSCLKRALIAEQDAFDVVRTRIRACVSGSWLDLAGICICFSNEQRSAFLTFSVSFVLRHLLIRLPFPISLHLSHWH